MIDCQIHASYYIDINSVFHIALFLKVFMTYAFSAKYRKRIGPDIRLEKSDYRCPSWVQWFVGSEFTENLNC